jgi:hypothetical protein
MIPPGERFRFNLKNRILSNSFSYLCAYITIVYSFSKKSARYI